MQPDKKEKNFWVVLDVDDYKKLNDLADSKQIPIKEFAGKIIKKSLVNDDEISIVLKMPKCTLNSSEKIQEWMNQKTKELIGFLNNRTN
jgi:hypothetical protein